MPRWRWLKRFFCHFCYLLLYPFSLGLYCLIIPASVTLPIFGIRLQGIDSFIMACCMYLCSHSVAAEWSVCNCTFRNPTNAWFVRPCLRYCPNNQNIYLFASSVFQILQSISYFLVQSSDESAILTPARAYIIASSCARYWLFGIACPWTSVCRTLPVRLKRMGPAVCRR